MKDKKQFNNSCILYIKPQCGVLSVIACTDTIVFSHEIKQQDIVYRVYND